VPTKEARRPGSGLLRRKTGTRLGDAGGRLACSASEHHDAILQGRPARGAPCVSLGPSSEIDDEHHEQNDDEKTDQSVAGSGDCKHVYPPLMFDAKTLLIFVEGSLPAFKPSQTHR
jgi:hypothetical protein